MATDRSKSRRERAALTREGIELEALRLIEAQGMDAFSVRKLGERLGCEAMSIYHHFDSKAHILDALVDRLLASMARPSRELTPQKRLRLLAESWRQLARAHPRFYLWLALHRWNSETGISFLSEVLDCFYDAGLDPEQAARGFRAVGYYVLGATLDEVSGYAAGPSALHPMSPARMAKSFPRVAEAGQYFSPPHFDKTFELGFNALLEALGIADAKPASGRTRRV